MPRNSPAVSKDVREVIDAAYEGARAGLTGRLQQEQVDQQALEDGVAAVRGAIAAMIQLDQPDHPILRGGGAEDFFARVHRAPTLRDEFLSREVSALLERFGASARNIDVLQEALAPLDGRAPQAKRRATTAANIDRADGEETGHGAKRRAEIREALIGELRKWVAAGEQGKFTNSAAFQERLGCDGRTCVKVLGRMVEEGLLKQQGKFGGAHYILTAKGRRELIDAAPRRAVAA